MGEYVLSDQLVLSFRDMMVKEKRKFYGDYLTLKLTESHQRDK